MSNPFELMMLKASEHWSRYQDIKWPTKYNMSKQPNKWFEHNIFHDEQAIYPLQSGRKQGKLLKSLANKFFFWIWNLTLNKKRNAGGDMSFLICGPGPGGSFTQFWWVLPKMVGFLPNFGDKMPDFRGQAGDLIVSKNILSLFCKSIPGRV